MITLNVGESVVVDMGLDLETYCKGRVSAIDMKPFKDMKAVVNFLYGWAGMEVPKEDLLKAEAIIWVVGVNGCDEAQPFIPAQVFLKVG